MPENDGSQLGQGLVWKAGKLGGSLCWQAVDGNLVACGGQTQKRQWETRIMNNGISGEIRMPVGRPTDIPGLWERRMTGRAFATGLGLPGLGRYAMTAGDLGRVLAGRGRLQAGNGLGAKTDQHQSSCQQQNELAIWVLLVMSHRRLRLRETLCPGGAYENEVLLAGSQPVKSRFP